MCVSNTESVSHMSNSIHQNLSHDRLLLCSDSLGYWTQAVAWNSPFTSPQCCRTAFGIWNPQPEILYRIHTYCPHLWALISTASAVLVEEPQSWGNLSVSELGLILESLTKIQVISGAVLEEVTIFIEMENNVELQIFLFICSHIALTQQSFSVLLLGEGFLYEGLIWSILKWMIFFIYYDQLPFLFLKPSSLYIYTMCIVMRDWFMKEKFMANSEPRQ